MWNDKRMKGEYGGSMGEDDGENEGRKESIWEDGMRKMERMEAERGMTGE